MPPKKPSVLDKIRKLSKTRAASAPALPDSAFSQLSVRPAFVQIEDDLPPEKKKKKVKKPVGPSKAVDKPLKVTKPSVAPPLQHPAVKRKASIAQVIKKEKPKPRTVIMSEYDSDPETPSPPRKAKEAYEKWLPFGGEPFSEDDANPVSRILGVARVPDWKLDSFTSKLGELLENLDVDDFRIKVRTDDLEEFTDVMVKFDGPEEAEAALKKLHWKILGRRVLRVKFV